MLGGGTIEESETVNALRDGKIRKTFGKAKSEKGRCRGDQVSYESKSRKFLEEKRRGGVGRGKLFQKPPSDCGCNVQEEGIPQVSWRKKKNEISLPVLAKENEMLRRMEELVGKGGDTNRKGRETGEGAAFSFRRRKKRDVTKAETTS